MVCGFQCFEPCFLHESLPIERKFGTSRCKLCRCQLRAAKSMRKWRVSRDYPGLSRDIMGIVWKYLWEYKLTNPDMICGSVWKWCLPLGWTIFSEGNMIKKATGFGEKPYDNTQYCPNIEGTCSIGTKIERFRTWNTTQLNNIWDYIEQDQEDGVWMCSFLLALAYPLAALALIFFMPAVGPPRWVQFSSLGAIECKSGGITAAICSYLLLNDS